MGFLGTARGNGATALGGYSVADGLLASAIGYGSQVTSQGGAALGYRASVSGASGLALGSTASATARGAVAIGAGARAEEADVVSFGTGDGIGGVATRRLTRVAAGRIAGDSTDAINGGQLFPQLLAQAHAFGGDATFDPQQGFVAPTYRVGGSSYRNVGEALAALDGRVGEIAGDTASLAVQAGQTARQVEALEAAQAALAAQPTLVTATANGSTTVGVDARVDPERGNATAVGNGALATAAAATALGQQAQATANDAVALGQDAQATATGATGLGQGARAAAAGAVALGQHAQATAGGAMALGEDAKAGAAGAMALGQNTQATADGAMALGQDAQASASGAVAIGQGAQADRADSVSIGRAGAERQLTHVAAGSEDTDAVNKAQLDQGVAAANRYTDQRHSALSDSFALHRADVDDRFRRQDQRIDRQGAINAAMLNMATSAAGLRTQNRVGVGVGFQSGQSALSLGYQRAISERATVTFGGAFSGSEASLGLGAGFGW